MDILQLFIVGFVVAIVNPLFCRLFEEGSKAIHKGRAKIEPALVGIPGLNPTEQDRKNAAALVDEVIDILQQAQEDKNGDISTFYLTQKMAVLYANYTAAIRFEAATEARDEAINKAADRYCDWCNADNGNKECCRTNRCEKSKVIIGVKA